MSITPLDHRGSKLQLAFTCALRAAKRVQMWQIPYSVGEGLHAVERPLPAPKGKFVPNLLSVTIPVVRTTPTAIVGIKLSVQITL